MFIKFLKMAKVSKENLYIEIIFAQFDRYLSVWTKTEYSVLIIVG